MFAANWLIAVAAVNAAEAADYLGPCAVVASRDGKTVYVANADAREIAFVDVAKRAVGRRIAVPAEPTGIVLSPDGETLLVTCAASKSTVCVLDADSGRLLVTIAAGHTSMGPAVAPDGTRLYVCNRFDNDVSVIDLQTARETARVPVTREPVAAAVTPNGKSVLVANHLPAERSDSFYVTGVVTAIDAQTHETSVIRLPNGSIAQRGICISSDGRYAYVTHGLANYELVPVQLDRGWANTNVLTIIDAVHNKRINTVVLDDMYLGAANPWAVAATADGKSLCVTHAGTHELSVIDLPRLFRKLGVSVDAGTNDREAGTLKSSLYVSPTVNGIPSSMGIMEGVRRRIELPGHGPRGLAVVGSKAYVAQYFSDTLEVVDLHAGGRPVDTIALGPTPRPDMQRRGEMLFHDATICYQLWQSCASCHPDARADALNWDLTNDGVGNPKNTKSLLLAMATPPAMAAGVRPSGEAAVRAGLRHILFTEQSEERAGAIDRYLRSLRPVPSPYLVSGRLSPAAERGKTLFESDTVGCHRCHPAPSYTDLRMHDVSSASYHDHRDRFDTPTLVEVWRTAPYMHDGRHKTIREVFTKGKHGLDNGRLEKLTLQQIDDLAEFVLSL